MVHVHQEDLYNDIYYDYFAEKFFLRSANSTDFYPEDLTVVNRSLLTVLLRVGFVLLQIGSIPITNVNLILLQNVVDICCSSLAYLLIGFIIAYNGDQAGLIGGGSWIGEQGIEKEKAIIGWQAVLTSSAISTSAVVGRTHTIGYVLVSFILSGLIQPFVIHWIWTDRGWMAENQLDGKRVIFRDYSGAATVHLVGGLTALIGCLALGRRILRLRDVDESSIGSSAPGSVFAGQLLIFIGLLGMSVPNHESERSRLFNKLTSHVLVNNFLAASSCSLFVVALHFALSRESFNHWTVMRCAQAIIAGLVTISAGVNVYSPLTSIGLGCLGGLAFYLVSSHIFHSSLEDYCNVIATHLTCSVLGSILAPLCVPPSEIKILRLGLNFSWQLICLIALMTFVVPIMMITFVLLNVFGILRNRSEHLNHERAMIALGKGPRRNFRQRLFVPDDDAIFLQPSLPSGDGEETVGSRFSRYRAEIDNVEGGTSLVRDEEGETGVVKSGNDNEKIAQAPGMRVKKLRQIHTLPTYGPQYSIPAGSSIANANGIFAVTDEYFKGSHDLEDVLPEKIWMSEGDLKCNPEKIVETAKAAQESLNYTDEIIPTSIGNYKLRRTLKSMNLRRDLEKQESKFEVLLKPKFEDNWSSDSQEDSLVECK